MGFVAHGGGARELAGQSRCGAASSASTCATVMWPRPQLCWGRAYSVTGRIVEGDKRGRQLGVPTANLAVDPVFLLPGDGVYATHVHVLDGPAAGAYAGATNIGVRPTVDGLHHRGRPICSTTPRSPTPKNSTERACGSTLWPGCAGETLRQPGRTRGPDPPRHRASAGALRGRTIANQPHQPDCEIRGKTPDQLQWEACETRLAVRAQQTSTPATARWRFQMIHDRLPRSADRPSIPWTA